MRRLNHSRLLKIAFVVLCGLLFLLIILIWIAIGYFARTTPPIQPAADHLVILGARAFRDGSPNPCLVARIDAALAYAHIHDISSVIVSGGIDKEDGINEAEFMNKLIRTKSPRSNLTVYEEKEATSTYENVIQSSLLAHIYKLQRPLFVTEPFHALRVWLIAHKLGLNADVLVATESPCWTRWGIWSRYTLREIPAIVHYFFKGYL